MANQDNRNAGQQDADITRKQPQQQELDRDQKNTQSGQGGQQPQPSKSAPQRH